MLKWKKLFPCFLLLLFVISIPLSFSTITFSSTTYFQSSSSSWFNFSTSQTFNTYERRAEWHYFNNKGVSTSTANATFINFLTSNWINYTVTGVGQQYFYYFLTPLAVYIDGALCSEGSGWYELLGMITVYGATAQAQISWNEIPEEPGTPPPPYPEELTVGTPAISGTLASGSFRLLLQQDDSVGFKDNDYYWKIELTSADTLNGSASIIAHSYSGEFRFESNTTGTMQLNTNLTNIKVRINNADPSPMIDGSTFSFSDGDNILIAWGLVMEPLLPILFILGMFGLTSLFISGIYGAYLINNRDFDEDKLILVVATFAIGFGLFIAWVMA